MQDFMEQCKEVRPSIAHQGYFEAGVERSGAVWFQVVWDKFWDEMLPGLRDAWAEKRVDKHRVTAMPSLAVRCRKFWRTIKMRRVKCT